MDKISRNLSHFYRLLISLGRPFGLRWVNDNEMAVIHRLERYHGLRGPGFFWLNPLTEFVHSITDFTSVEVPDVQTRDALPFEMSVGLAYRFDPDLIPPDKAAAVLPWSRDTHRVIVTDNAQQVLREIVPVFSSVQIRKGEAFDAIEQELKGELAKRLRPMAIEPLMCTVLQVKVPGVLPSGLETVLRQARSTQTRSDDSSIQLQPRAPQDGIETFRVDTAVPKQALLDRVFEIAVTVRRNSSPVLKEDELTLARSRDVQISWFTNRRYISLRIQVSAPECEISGPDSYSFRLYAGHDSPVFYFHITPKKVGEIGIIVCVFQEDDWLGGTRAQTVVQDQAVGNLQMSILSHYLNGSLGEGAVPIDTMVLRQIFVLRFSFEELRTLCADLDVGFDILPGEGQEAKARELIAYLQRRERLGQLVAYIRQHRPDINL